MRSFRKPDNAPRFLFLSVLALFLFFAACAAMPAKKAGTTPPGESKMAMTAPEAPAEARAATDKAEASAEKEKATAARPAHGQEASGLKAGYADGNKQV